MVREPYKGIVYRLNRITDSVLDKAHGNFYSISEVFIPELGIAFNRKTIHKPEPKDNPTRYRKNAEKLREIKIDPEDAAVLQQYFVIKKKSEDVVSKYLTS